MKKMNSLPVHPSLPPPTGLLLVVLLPAAAHLPTIWKLMHQEEATSKKAQAKMKKKTTLLIHLILFALTIAQPTGALRFSPLAAPPPAAPPLALTLIESEETYTDSVIHKTKRTPLENPNGIPTESQTNKKPPHHSLRGKKRQAPLAPQALTIERSQKKRERAGAREFPN